MIICCVQYPELVINDLGVTFVRGVAEVTPEQWDQMKTMPQAEAFVALEDTVEEPEAPAVKEPSDEEIPEADDAPADKPSKRNAKK